MQTIDAALAELLQGSIIAPRCYVIVQLPLIVNQATNSMDFNKLGSQLVLDEIASVRIESYYEIGSNTLEFAFDNTSGWASPISQSSLAGRYFSPGLVDNKFEVYLGATSGVSPLEENLLPQGVFISKAFNQESKDGVNKATVECTDQFAYVQGNVYTQFPPRLYGSQTSSYFDSSYALTNPTTDGKTWVGDTANWMQSNGQNAAFDNDYTPVVVYTSDIAGGATATTHSYTLNYNEGIVQFSQALAAGTVVSVDARPLAMAPEKMMYHIFKDFGAMDPSFFRFDTSGIMLPVMEYAYDLQVQEIAQQVVYCTAPRGILWVLYFDEQGYLHFEEPYNEGSPVVTLIDEYDILSFSPEYTVENMTNVVTAICPCVTDQELEAISFDATSISLYGQKPELQVNTDYLAGVKGMDTGSGMAFMQGLCNSFILSGTMPQIQTAVEIFYNPALQAGDPIEIIEKKTGTAQQFYILQNTIEIDSGNVKQTLRVQQYVASQDFQFGLSYYAGAAQDVDPDAYQTDDTLLQTVSIAGTTVVQNGGPVYTENYTPLVAVWDGGALDIDITTYTDPGNGDIFLWRWFYIAADSYGSNGQVNTADGRGTNVWGNSLSASSVIGGELWTTAAYDVLNDIDSARSRRFYWPLLRCPDWVANDGVTNYSNQTVTSTWDNGPGTEGNYYVYGTLRLGQTDFFNSTSPGFLGQALYAAGTPAATAIGQSSTTKYGVDFGYQLNGTNYYGIQRPQTWCYLGIMAGSTSGVVQLKRIPFILAPTGVSQPQFDVSRFDQAQFQ